MTGGQGRQRNFRSKKAEEEESEVGASGSHQHVGEAELAVSDKLVDTRMLQKFRRRAVGVDSSALAIKPDRLEEAVGPVEEEDEEHEVLDAFSKAKAETSVAEEDPNMQKYVEEELARRLGKVKDEYDGLTPAETKRRKIEKDLYSIPDDLKNNMSAEVIIPGMLTGITEIPLTATQRMHNVEQIESMKRRMLAATGQGYVDEVQEALEMQQKTGFRRGLFTASFGRTQPKQCTLDAAGQKALRKKVVSDGPVKRSQLKYDA